ncbi:hypothetical protein [Cytobacillus sp. IB215665]|uniref:hypothetical protein n=1 Tax=Cytobacillus sp. IB215665 TaxID=3097357 RepID=UPI002A0B05D1|nr:hypothetical protein [Cytobacillus sp. IB215665]MDX8367952.1 hypothetical protein [Cytobacillus sp. IB215665]
MSTFIVFLVVIVIIIFISVLLYSLIKNKSKNLMKYIPSIVSALSIVLVYLKMSFISQGYEPITDMVVIIVLSIILGFSLLGAVLIDILNCRKDISK